MSVSHLVRSGSLAPVVTSGAGSGVVTSVLPHVGIALAAVEDPRRRRGVRHSLFTVLALSALAVLAGAVSFREIADYAADLSQASLVQVRARWCPQTEAWTDLTGSPTLGEERR